MCHFLSALVTRSGEVLTQPEYTDSHEDLVEYYGLADDGQKFCRVEFMPKVGPEKLEGYAFEVDDPATPSWFDEELKARVIAELKLIVGRMLVTQDRPILLGGCHIIGGKLKIGRIKGGRVISICGSAEVGSICGSAKVDSIYGSAKVDSLGDSAKVGSISGSAQVDSICGSAKVDSIGDSAKVGSISGSANVGYIYSSAKVDSIYDSANVGSIYGSAKVDYISDSANVGYISGSAVIVNDRRVRRSSATTELEKAKEEQGK